VKTSKQQFKQDNQRFRVVANFDIAPEARWEELKGLLVEPEQVYGDDQDTTM
jgi:hypothetical protein